ncbi:MAG: T9SS type A sorting domain-containing protein, partial [Bacteroidia bacterium]|nr:T9SS type A sorting domain-containing protein [Bacteroidia bacterium]
MKIITTLLLISLSIGANAQAWINQISGSTNPMLAGCFFLNDNLGYVSGMGGEILKTSNGGSTWNTLASGTTQDLYSLYFSSADTGYAVGNNSTVLKTINGGTSWTTLNSGTTGIAFRNVSKFNGNQLYIVGAGGNIRKSTNAGSTWTALNTGLTSQLYCVHFTDLNTGYACGDGGKIIKTTNGGTTWTQLTTGTTIQLLYIQFIDANVGYATGGNLGTGAGIVLKTTNGGTSWTQETFPSTYFGYLKFMNANYGYIIGGDVSADTTKIYKTTNGGASWTIESASSTRMYRGSFPGTTGYAVGTGGKIIKISGLVGMSDISSNEFNMNAFPNPFNNNIRINFSLKKNEKITIQLSNVLGELVKIVPEKEYLIGENLIELDNLNELVAGQYFLTFKTEKSVETTRIVKI